jgi:hypothetical protein
MGANISRVPFSDSSDEHTVADYPASQARRLHQSGPYDRRGAYNVTFSRRNRLG